jgi:hypothetical protein
MCSKETVGVKFSSICITERHHLHKMLLFIMKDAKDVNPFCQMLFRARVEMIVEHWSDK